MQRYNSYKPSGAEWLGNVPAHWDVQPLRAVTALKSDKNRPELSVLSVYREYGVILKDSRDDNHNATSLDTRAYKVVKPGDLVVNKMKAWQGSMGVSAHDGIVSPAYITCATRADRVRPQYLHYMLRSSALISVYNSLSYGVRVGQWDMHYEDFKQIPIPLPPQEEQDRIVAFLDQKTAEIDAAIVQKGRLIELLDEKQNILLDDAITKGLVSTKFRDSGIDWIGKIPEHWKVKPLKYLLRSPLKYGANEEAKEDNRDNPRYIRITDFGDDGQLRNETFRSLPFKKAKDYLLSEGDILFARSGATVGKTFIFQDYAGKACYAGYLIKAEVDRKEILPGFLYAYTKSPTFTKWKDENFSIATIQNIGADKYASLKVCVPPLNEQKNIVEYVKRLTKSFGATSSSAAKEIAILQEMKKELVSSVVTGKIKI